MELELDRRAPAVYKDCVTSTNTILKGLAASGVPDGFTLVAARQTSGRGRLGRGFASPEGGLYLSMLLYPGADARRRSTLTPCAAVAVCRAVERVCGVTPGIKWPNDLLLGDKKLCGILTEASTALGRAYVVIGLGVNVNTAPDDFPPDVRGTAVSLLEATGQRFDIKALAVAIIEELDGIYAAWKQDTACVLDEYRRLCVSIDRPVTLIRADERREAYALGIDDNYALIADINGTEEHITMGEVSLRSADNIKEGVQK